MQTIMPGGESKASRFEAFFHACPDLLAIAGPHGHLEQVNEAWTALLGWSEEELVGTSLTELAAEEGRAAIAAAFAGLRAPGTTASWQARFPAKDGSLRRLAVECRRAAAEELIAVSARDITSARAKEEAPPAAPPPAPDVVIPIIPRAEHERALKESQEILRMVLDHTPLILWAIDIDGICRVSDGLGLEKVNLRPGQLVGRSFHDIFADAPESIACIARALAGKSSSRLLEIGDTAWESRYVPQRDEAGAVIGMFGISLDLTDMVKNERELRQRIEVIERQQSAIRSMSTPIIQVWDDVVALPIIGVLDSTRATAIMETLLTSIVRTRARYAIIDLTGVETVDTATADHIIKVIYAVQLLGARGIVTGIQPMVAQIMTGLGIELSRIATLRNLRDAIKACMRHADAQRARAAEEAPRAPLLPARDHAQNAG
jgi:rsbT co-antagonist protein RsbR